jgi:small-conductance mechanosensitive channel
MNQIIREQLERWQLHPYVWNVLLISASLLMGFLLSLLSSLFLKKGTETQGRFHFRRSLMRHLSAPVSLLVPLFFFNNVLPLFQAERAIRNGIGHLVEIMLILGFAWLLVRFLRVAQEVVHAKIDINTKNNLRQRQIITQLMYIRRVLFFIIVLLTIGAVLLTFDTMRKVGTGLLTGVGVGGIIIGLAAQRSLANLLAGFQIAFTQPIRIDDEVVVEGEFGKVEELTLTYVVVRIWDNRRMVLPINYFLEKPFQNWTRTSSDILGTAFFYVDYSLPVDWARKEFLEIVKHHPLWDQRTASLVVTDLKQDVMELRALISAASSGHAYDLRCHVREQLIQRIQQAYPQCLPKTRAVLVSEVKATGEM